MVFLLYIDPKINILCLLYQIGVILSKKIDAGASIS